MSTRSRSFVLAVALFCLALLSGCQEKVALYTNLPESQVNLMMALLVRMGVPCEKTAGAEGQFTLLVDHKDFPAAINVLNFFGYPMNHSTALADLVKNQGLISSPGAEAMRHNFALADELGKTIERVNGIVSAQVFIVLGASDDPTATRVSSASVFIKYREGHPIEKEVPKIKDLVLNSVLGLEADKITVVTFGTNEWDYTDFSGITGYDPASAATPMDWPSWAAPIAALGIAVAGFGGVAAWRTVRGRAAAKREGAHAA